VIIIQLIYNLSVLVALSVFSVFIETRFKRNELSGKLLQGILFGLTTIIGMIYPFKFAEGIIFDGRSIVISLCTLFFGPLSGIISALMAAIYRISIGGGGLLMGVFVIIESFLVGYFFYKVKNKDPEQRFTKIKLYQMGLIVHAFMLLLVILLPSKNIMDTYKAISFTVLGIYPLVTVLIGRILLDHEENVTSLKKLTESERKYQLLTEVAPVGIFRTDINGKTTYVNKRWSEISSLSFEEALQDNWMQAVHPDDKKFISADFEKALKEKRVAQNEYRFVRKDGSIAWVLGKAVPQLDSDGQIVGHIGTITDITESKNAARVIAQSERNYREIFNSTGEAIFIHEANTGKILDVNNAMLKMYGYDSKEEVINGNIGDLSADEAMYNEDVAQGYIKKTNEVDRLIFEWYARRKNGQKFWVEISLQKTEIGGKGRVLAVARDINERKNSEDALRKSEERFRNLFENNLAVMMLIDPDDQSIIDANKAAEKFYGWSISELKKMKVNQINTLSSSEIDLEINKARRLGRIHFEFKHRLADGSVRDVEIFSSKIVIEGKDYLYTIVHDITDKKSMEQKNLLLSRVIEQSSISVIITNPEAQIEYVNKGLIEKTGYSLEELLGQNPRILNSGQNPDKLYQEMWKALLSGNEWIGELLNKTKNGDLYWEKNTIFPIVNKEGVITHFVGLKEDITEKKNMLDDLIAAKDRAEHSERLKSEFLSQMSHEIRSPLNVTLNFANLLKDELENQLNDQQLDYFENIETAGKRLMRTVDLILNSSEMQVGTYEPIWTEFDIISDILLSTKSEYQNLASKKNLELKYESNIPNAIIRADKYSVYQIFVNLIDNAIKYTNKGSIAIKVEPALDNKIKITLEDTGIGMSQEYVENLFTPFMQEDRGYSRRFDGNGLGLALVKKYCDLNNAKIEVESKKDVGTKFSVYFELKSDWF
jgi:PAS domain S-box-containing protein